VIAHEHDTEALKYVRLKQDKKKQAHWNRVRIPVTETFIPTTRADWLKILTLNRKDWLQFRNDFGSLLWC